MGGGLAFEHVSWIVGDQQGLVPANPLQWNSLEELAGATSSLRAMEAVASAPPSGC